MTQSANTKIKTPLRRAIIHVDMDAFYASVEQNDQPQYRGLPVIVGGSAARGVVSAASYEVRKFGVFSAMPIGQARRRCPQAVILPVRMSRYREVSRQVFEIFHEVTPMVEGLSLDEAFLDVTGSLSLLGSIETIGAHIRAEILKRTGLHASVGMAHNKYLAKLASDARKPQGFVHVPFDGVQSFLDPMPVKRIWGLGKKTLPKIQKLGILTMGQLRKADPMALRGVLGNRAEHFQALTRGEDERPVMAASGERSISREVTFDRDLTQARDMLAELQRQAQSVGERLRAQSLLARTIQIKIRDQRFRTVTRSRSLAAPTSSSEVIFKLARELLNKWLTENSSTAVRLLGVGASALEVPDKHSPVFETARQKAVDQTMDAIKQRYGESKLTRALALRPGKKPEH